MSQHVPDLAVVERRLRPIYDSFEVGNNKKALHEAEKVLKKSPNLRCAKALKGLALMRLGKIDESNAIIDQIVSEKPSDESTLQVLSFIFKETNEVNKICLIYQNAAEQDPTNEETLTHLFMSYARVSDFAGQQRIAMQLYKLKQKNPYYCWAVMSCVLKAIRGQDRDEPAKKKLSLELAQRMMEKFISDDKLDAEQEVQLYLIILEHQQKYQLQLEFLDSTIGTKIYPGAPIELRVKLLKQLGQWAQVNVLLKGLLREQLDRWDFYQDYIESVVHLVKSAATLSEEECKGEKVDVSFESCHEFICELIEASNKKFRGPYLGRLELYRAMTKNDANAKELFGDFAEMLTEYFTVFGHKPCCSKDIALFLNDLESEKQSTLATKLIQLCEISSTTLPKTIEQMQRHICSLQISRLCGAHSLSVDHLTALYTAFTLHYEHGFNAFGLNALPTDIGSSDAYAMLAVQVMHDLALKLNSSDRLVEALCLLNYLLSNSPSNFHAKLLCLQIYHRLGCAYGAQKMYESLNFKFIQHDSMGYLHAARLMVCGMPSLTRAVLETTGKFTINSYKEGYEHISMCYKYGSFSKLEEFMDFHERLANSLHFEITHVDLVLLEFIEYNYKFYDFNDIHDKLDTSKLRDNRDLSVIVRWDPKQNEPEQKEIDVKSFEQDKDLARIRYNLMHLIIALIEAATKEPFGRNAKKSTENGSNYVDQLENQLKRWIETFESVRKANHQPTSNEFLVNLLPSRVHGVLSMPYENIFTNISKLILSFEQRSSDPIDIISKNLDDNLIAISEFICKTIEGNNSSNDLLWNRRSVKEFISNSMEIYALLTLVVNFVYEKYLVSQTKNAPKRNKKKTVDEPKVNGVYVPSEKERTQAISSLINRLKLELNTFDAALESWKSPILPKNLTEILAALSLNPTVETLVEGTIRKDHEVSVDELRALIKDKLKMLNAMNKINTS